MMKRPLPYIAVAFLLVGLLVPASSSASFGLKELDYSFADAQGATLSQAGAHPFALKVNLAVNTKPEPALPELGEVPDGEVRDLFVTQITGLAGNPKAAPRCSTLDFLSGPACQPATQLGTVRLNIGNTIVIANAFNLDPPPGGVAKFGFVPIGLPVAVEATLEPTPPYDILATTTNITNQVTFFSATLTLWGVPAAPAHDEERGGLAANVPEVPFLTTPRACEGPLGTLFEVTSWQGDFFEEEILTHDDAQPPRPLGFTGCGKLAFAPRAAAKPTSDQAESPSGLDFNLDIEDEGLANPDGIAASDIEKARVILPRGVTLNPSIAEGLATCAKADYEAENLDPGSTQGCPGASKVGTVEAETPLLEGTVLKGGLFVATQDDPATTEPEAENPFDSLIALYMVIKEPEQGILVKLAGKVEPNPLTGQIETTFGEPGNEIIQEPLSHVRIHLREGGRSPLITPPSCDSDPSTPKLDPYLTEAIFTPWADPTDPLTTGSSFAITRGVGGGPCPPAGTPPFAPGFEAGTINNNAKSFSPFDMRLTRRDGDQDLTKFSALLPPGVAGIIAGVAKCPEAGIEAAKAKSGRAELASPSCPANSQIGRTLAGAGVGSQLTYVPGKLYLAGPYQGDPLSVVAITSAVAGPFDVGTVVVREALKVNPETAEVEADGSRSDPIPHILKGIVLKVRDIRVYVDRHDFIYNPTNCRASSARATIFGSFANVFDPADDVPVSREARFQAANCAGLPFKPALTMTLNGGVKRGAHPAVKAVLTPRPQDANLAKAVVTLPRSAFLDQGHIRTICTRVQFAAKSCPAASVYGHAFVKTPVLDEPLEGPIYLRSSDHNLPDMVLALHGLVDFNNPGRIDSHKGGIRVSFETIPDVPVSQAVLTFPGGQKGLIVNSRNLCAKASRASAVFTGQNGRRLDFNPPLKALACRGKHKKHKKHSS